MDPLYYTIGALESRIGGSVFFEPPGVLGCGFVGGPTTKGLVEFCRFRAQSNAFARNSPVTIRQKAQCTMVGT